MSKNKDSIANIVKVAGLVCLVCALIVSYAAISLRPLQEVNKEREVKKNILAAAGLYDESKSVEEQFQAITTRLVDIESGEYVVDMNPENYDSRAAIRDPRQSEKLTDRPELMCYPVPSSPY